MTRPDPALGDGAAVDLLGVVMVAGVASGTRAESLSDAAGLPCVDIAPDAWRVVLQAAKDAGGRLDWLAGTDDSSGVELVACVRDDRAEVLVRTTVPAGAEVPSVRDVHPGAGWHEREVTEMVGLRFAGGDDRPLLLHGRLPGNPPLRRAFPLAARVATPWPGAASSTRRTRIPGNNPGWQEPPQ